MDNNLPKFSVYSIFDKDYNYMFTVSTKKMKDKALKEYSKAKFFMELKVNDMSVHVDSRKYDIEGK
ncbi:hypothetical protein [Staphylococcus phage PMBT8]|nr:hypothetical protein [Staphylococcus phage PMBT8]